MQRGLQRDVANGDRDGRAPPFLEFVPDVDAKLKAPNMADENLEDVVKLAQDAAVLVLVY